MNLLSTLTIPQRVLAGVALACVVAVAILIGLGFVDRAFDTAEQAGASKGAAAAAEKGLTHVENANRAAEAVAHDPAVRDADCLRHSRTPENC